MWQSALSPAPLPGTLGTFLAALDSEVSWLEKLLSELGVCLSTESWGRTEEDRMAMQTVAKMRSGGEEG